MGKLVTRLQLERGEVAFFIYTNGSLLRANLTERFLKTDSAIENMSSWDEIVVPASPNGNVYIFLSVVNIFIIIFLN